jgi:hypothetical protein
MKPIVKGFVKGMSSITLFPAIPQRSSSPGNAWNSVGKAFQAVGDNMRKAMYEQPAPTPKESR